jgi:hypothetical protein
MYYTNEFIDELETKVTIDKDMYANIQAHNVVKMLAGNKSKYKLFGVYWWAVKDALRKYVDNGEWYCGKQDDPLMKERAWHGSEFRTMLAAMFYYNEHHLEITSACTWYDKDGESHEYTLLDPDANC